jgi:hypothetical protein
MKQPEIHACYYCYTVRVCVCVCGLVERQCCSLNPVTKWGESQIHVPADLNPVQIDSGSWVAPTGEKSKCLCRELSPSRPVRSPFQCETSFDYRAVCLIVQGPTWFVRTSSIQCNSDLVVYMMPVPCVSGNTDAYFNLTCAFFIKI